MRVGRGLRTGLLAIAVTVAACGSETGSEPPPALDDTGADAADASSPYDGAAADDAQDAGEDGAGPEADPGDATDDAGALSCTSCHGDPATGEPAPPRGTKGESLESEHAVGAHRKHLGKSVWHREVACGDCHVLPTSTAHKNGKVDLAFSALATAPSGPAPGYDSTTFACGSVYCHGATLKFAAATASVAREPVFNRVDGSYSACGSACHANPPGGAHPASSACPTCHGAVISAWDPATKVAVWKEPTLHIDGIVEKGTLSCTTCHGNPATKDPAPPLSTRGELVTSAQRVGAHQAHLATSTWRRDMTCAECHALPTSPFHTNGVTDLSWGGVSKMRGNTPTYDFTSATCASVYCHGSGLMPAVSGGTVTRTPTWNVVDGTFNACGVACHTNPPGGTHAASTDCAKCHGDVIASYDAATKTATWKNRLLHVNGVVERIGLTCTTCHGNPATKDPAPPTSTLGETASTARRVGAHQKHLATSTWRRDMTCAECHTLPTSTSHANGVTDLVWGAISRTRTSAPSYDFTTATCTGVYCHGNGLLGATVGGTIARAPVWNQADGTWNACGSTCHTNPPGGTHTNGTDCAKCHGDVIASYDAATKTATWKNRLLHVNGVVETTALTCTSCHGDPAVNAAPPKGTKGETTTLDSAVGAHQTHLAPSTWHRVVTCGECHAVPTSTSHQNGVTETAFGSLASAGGAKPSYAGGSCASVYCHGATLAPAVASGLVRRSPVWTTVDGSYDSCGSSCHTNPPGGTHPLSTACTTCHGDVISSYDPVTATATWKSAARHIDGVVDVTSGLTCTSCHGDAAKGDPAPPRGTKGETATTAEAVGAHQKHLGPSTSRRDILCNDCHVVPTSTTHTNGKTDFAWSSIASAEGATPMYDPTLLRCTSVYCHGTTLMPAATGGVVRREPVFNVVDGTYGACGASCHTNPPGGTHPPSAACPTCHGAVIASFDPLTRAATWKDRTLHVDGIVERTTLTCTSCHGDAISGDPAPPRSTKGETVTTAQRVGAHQKHLAPSSWRKTMACVECHVVPTSTTHFDGTTQLSFGALATARTSKPSYDFASATCTTVYCHGAGLMAAVSGGAVSRSPIWNVVDGTHSACGSTCHTNPPGGTHPNDTKCALCHGAVISAYDPTTKAATWKDASLHVNGTVERITMTCTTCHGDPLVNEAPPTGTKGETATTQSAVGAHQQHLAGSGWHKDVLCADCHAVPTSTSHADGVRDLAFSALASSHGATPSYAATTLTCANVYCHGTTLLPANSGGVVARSPVWTKVDGTWDACGTTCHTNPPGGTHPTTTACPTCHAPVISSYDPITKAAVWKDRTLHVNGVVDRADLTCTTCHGSPATLDPAPPRGTKGETSSTQAAVGAHQQHLGASTWRKDIVCNDCHVVPISTVHSNSVTELTWSTLASTGGATPLYTPSAATCSSVYCHGSTLSAAAPGGAVLRSPLWTKVDGTYDACGASCHTNPPGGAHVAHADCSICHAAVIKTWDPVSKTATWAPIDGNQKHVNGTVESNKYHDLAGWTAPRDGANHHGSNYFLRNRQKDEHGAACTACHGADLSGGTVSVSCNNTSCHAGRDWRGCTFCHGTPPSQNNPPVGVGGETTTSTLAVGRHVAHLTSSSTHVAFACATCHAVPATGDVSHALGYVAGAPLDTAGHHGDVTFSAPATGMAFNVGATLSSGGVVTARGTCLGACHSNGRGGAPAVTPYWAGGAWTSGSCTSCHANSMTALSERHPKHSGMGFSCTSCHPAASGSTHLNGVKNTASPLTDPAGSGSVTVTTGGATGNPCGSVATCNGTCHGKTHTNFCWR